MHPRYLLARLNELRHHSDLEKVNFFWAVVFCLFLGSIFLTANPRLHRNIYYVLVVVPFLFLAPWSFWSAMSRSPVFLGSLAFLGYLWISLLWVPDTSLYTFYNEARTLALLLIFLAISAYCFLSIENFTRMLARTLACVAGAASMISIYVFYSGKDIPMMGGLESRAVDIGLAAHPIDSAGLYGAVAIFLIFSLFVQAEKKGIWTWISGISLLSILTFVGLTQTRGAIVGIVLVLALGLLFQGGKRLWLVLGALTAVILGVVLLSFHHPEGMIGFERRLGVRGEIWILALERAWEQPWFGFGLNQHQQLFLSAGDYHGVAHNLYLENLHFGGVAGTVLLFALIVLAGRGAWREYRRTGSFLLPAIFIYPLIFGLSAGYLTLSKISPMWIQFWLPIGLIIGSEIRQRQKSARTGGHDSRPAPEPNSATT
ncbi:O-antigen ligase family protein [Desulfonatronum parangueonense]